MNTNRRGFFGWLAALLSGFGWGWKAAETKTRRIDEVWKGLEIRSTALREEMWGGLPQTVAHDWPDGSSHLTEEQQCEGVILGPMLFWEIDGKVAARK